MIRKLIKMRWAINLKRLKKNDKKKKLCAKPKRKSFFVVPKTEQIKI